MTESLFAGLLLFGALDTGNSGGQSGGAVGVRPVRVEWSAPAECPTLRDLGRGLDEARVRLVPTESGGEPEVFVSVRIASSGDGEYEALGEIEGADGSIVTLGPYEDPNCGVAAAAVSFSIGLKIRDFERPNDDSRMSQSAHLRQSRSPPLQSVSSPQPPQPSQPSPPPPSPGRWLTLHPSIGVGRTYKVPVGVALRVAAGVTGELVGGEFFIQYSYRTAADEVMPNVSVGRFGPMVCMRSRSPRVQRPMALVCGGPEIVSELDAYFGLTTAVGFGVPLGPSLDLVGTVEGGVPVYSLGESLHGWASIGRRLSATFTVGIMFDYPV